MNHLLWLDMEMTGLDPIEHKIIEVAAIVTDLNFDSIDTYYSPVSQPKSELDKMDDWCRKTHGASGLLNKLAENAGIDTLTLDKKLSEFTAKYWKKEKAVLAGNSISQDRKFIDLYLPQFASMLHYRMLDVSSWKVIFENKYAQKYKKNSKHSAIEDINESIEELKFYLSFLKMP